MTARTATARRALRVVHVPARTPYVWKLQGPDFRILNESDNDAGVRVPATADARWLLEQRPLAWLDVLHLHHIEFEDLAALERLLSACAEDGVRVVVTAHDVRPMFRTADELAERLRLLADTGAGWVCLTPGSAHALAELLGHTPLAAVIPHGYVVPPEALHGRERDLTGPPARYLLYGAIRPSRDHMSTIVNWSMGTQNPNARLHLLLRALSPVDFSSGESRVPELLGMVRSDLRIRTTMRPYPTDHEVITAGLGADALLLPYLWGSHSGQIELAFDLNLLPICSDIGHIRHGQYHLHKGLVDEPEWFDWSQGHPYLFGERFLAALERAAARLQDAGSRRLDPTFLDYRRAEHEQILAAYTAVYRGSA